MARSPTASSGRRRERVRCGNPNCGLPHVRARQVLINLGDLVEQDDIKGDGVNVAARLEALAEPAISRVCGTKSETSSLTRGLTRPTCEGQDRGDQGVKNV